MTKQSVKAPGPLVFILFRCSSSLDECTFIVNGSDVYGGDEAVLDTSQLTGPCIFRRKLNIAKNWYGYIANFTLRPHGAKMYFDVTYPERKCCVKLLLYLEEQVDRLRYHMNCRKKVAILDPMSPQIITLSPSYPWSGCTNGTNQGDSQQMLRCSSGRLITSDIERNWYVAVSTCGSPTGLDLEYRLTVYGYEGNCPHASYYDFLSDKASSFHPANTVYRACAVAAAVLLAVACPLSSLFHNDLFFGGTA